MNQSVSFIRTNKAVARVLLVSPFDEDQQHLGDLRQGSKWELHRVHTQREAQAFLHKNPAAVVICEANLPDGTWKDLHSRLAEMRHSPLLVVAATAADERLWAEVLNAGAYSVLSKPLDAQEVSHLLSFACLLWKNQGKQAQPRKSAAAA